MARIQPNKRHCRSQPARHKLLCYRLAIKVLKQGTCGLLAMCEMRKSRVLPMQGRFNGNKLAFLLLVSVISVVIMLLEFELAVNKNSWHKNDVIVPFWAHRRRVINETQAKCTDGNNVCNETNDNISVPSPTQAKCTEVDYIVFLKTHKTASTTLASILERFGYIRNLLFAVSKRGHTISDSHLFNSNMIPSLSSLNSKGLNISSMGTGYHLLTNHVRYNRPELDAVIHDAKYITIIREPVANFESAFGYFEMAKHLRLTSHKNPIETFMKTPKLFLDKHFYQWKRAKNGQLFDLGLEHKTIDDYYTVKQKIQKLDSEFDLVLITEYFDESLILLKRLMCWSFEDILYVSNGIRSASHRYALNFELRAKIREWNSADVMLYTHFNETLWRKIKEYEGNFDKDLAEFRLRQQQAMNKCIDDERLNKKDRREVKYVLKPNMTKSIFCQNLLRDDVVYTKLIRNKMKQYGLYLPSSPNKSIPVVPGARKPHSSNKHSRRRPQQRVRKT
ncbi:galactosylceramide sulfotransferase-like [Antedon mediterranea]|uniref:galactosylceramide sulfotransferase-like n=1 Tax=Antedon mediterranea TaxID=105859 RepID=UPI003AF54A36